MQQLIVATGNPGKLTEIKEILAVVPVVITSLRDHWNPIPSIAETGMTFFDNAKIKADWVFDKTGIWTLADDSGLEVDYLHGQPGVYSSRYAGDHATDEENNRKLLGMLGSCPPDQRRARFRCVVVVKAGAADYLSAEGTCEGMMGTSARGTGGFGYDPLFIPDGFTTTFSELDNEEKNRVSHRGRALRALQEKLYERLVR